MPFTVLVSNDAARDLDELYDYIALNSAPEAAEYLAETVSKLGSRPCGHCGA
jgi:toxin ParE1/3/4